LIRRAGGIASLITRRPLAHLARFLLSLVSMFSFFEALRHLPLATATTLAFSSPMFMTLLSRLVLREHVAIHRWAAIAVGFVGVLIIARPGGEVPDTWAAFLAIIAGMTYAASMVIVRWARSETEMAFVFYVNLGSLVCGVLAVPFVWTRPATLDVGLTAMMAVMLILAQLFMVRAFRYAPIATVAPFQYGELVVAAIIGLVVWREFPGP